MWKFVVGGCFNMLIAIVLRTCNECKKTNVFCDTKIGLISLPAKKNSKKNDCFKKKG